MASPPPMTINVDALYKVTITTDRGDIVMELDPSLAPNTVNNFVSLARDGYYDNLTFHRVVPEFVIQGGCPEGLAAHLSLADVERTTFHELLGVELAGATQTIAAAAVEAADAEVLGVPVGSPALVCERVTRSVGGDPVLVAEHVFPGHLTEFVVELATVESSVAPSGLRLVR